MTTTNNGLKEFVAEKIINDDEGKGVSSEDLYGFYMDFVQENRFVPLDEAEFFAEFQKEAVVVTNDAEPPLWPIRIRFSRSLSEGRPLSEFDAVLHSIERVKGVQSNILLAIEDLKAGKASAPALLQRVLEQQKVILEDLATATEERTTIMKRLKKIEKRIKKGK